MCPLLVDVYVMCVHYCSATLVDGMACDGVQLEQMVSFEVTVTLNSCYDQNTGELLVFPIR